MTGEEKRGDPSVLLGPLQIVSDTQKESDAYTL